MPLDPQKVALYCQGTFDIQNPTSAQKQQMAAAAQDIGTSGFGTVILGQWHVHSDGTVYYNDSLLDSVVDELKTVVKALKSGGKVTKVLIDVGPFASDFAGIEKNREKFHKAMAQLVKTGIDGFDWDLEQDLEKYSRLLVELNHQVKEMKLVTTAAPYYDQSFWNKVQKESDNEHGAGNSWWNLQLYGGTSYSDWVGPLSGVVQDPQAFLVPGWSISQGTTPASLQASLSSLLASYPSLAGGFVWRYEDIASSGYTTADFAQAIINGVTPPQPSPAGEILVPA